MGKKLFTFVNNISGFALKVGVVVYLTILLTHSMRSNIATERQIDQERKEIAGLRDEIVNMKNLLAYYQSPAYYELEARKRLNLQADGEKVIILPSPSSSTSVNQEAGIVAGAKTESVKTNYLLWWNYHFK